VRGTSQISELCPSGLAVACPVACWRDALMVSVEETPLPGVALRHDFVAGDGRRVGVVSRRNGHRELLVYSPRRPGRRVCGGPALR